MTIEVEKHPAPATSTSDTGSSAIHKAAVLITVCAVWLGALNSLGHAQTKSSQTSPKETRTAVKLSNRSQPFDVIIAGTGD